MITLLDYGAGNIRSVSNTLEALGASYHVTNRPEDVEATEKIVLPGVGHFGQMMRALDQLNLRRAIIDKAKEGAPFLGICVGLQCLFEGSDESPESEGLGIFPGRVRRFQGTQRIPHMGWNSLDLVRPSRLLKGLGPEIYTYFAHSFYAPVSHATAARCSYGEDYSAVIEAGNLFAVQFHPEKSGATGLAVMKNFLEV